MGGSKFAFFSTNLYRRQDSAELCIMLRLELEADVDVCYIKFPDFLNEAYNC